MKNPDDRSWNTVKDKTLHDIANDIADAKSFEAVVELLRLQLPHFAGDPALRKFSDNQRPQGKCYDCGFAYSDPAWVEAVVPHDVWEKINPTHYQGAGLLCMNCIARRCVAAGLVDVPVKLTAGPLVESAKAELERVRGEREGLLKLAERSLDHVQAISLSMASELALARAEGQSS